MRTLPYICLRREIRNCDWQGKPCLASAKKYGCCVKVLAHFHLDLHSPTQVAQASV